MTITGGRRDAGLHNTKRVIRYGVKVLGKNWIEENLPNLNNGRCQHACGKYSNSAGGIVSNNIIHSDSLSCMSSVF